MKKLLAFALILIVGCTEKPQPESKWHFRYDPPPFEINDIVTLKTNHKENWSVWEIKGDKIIGATYRTKRDRSVIFGGSFNDVVKEELSIYDLEREVRWYDDEPEPPRRTK